MLDELFQAETCTLSKQLTQPLADKISGYLQCIFGVGARAQVDLENSEFTGLQLYRPSFGNSPFTFANLSGGAKEQIAAAVRLAMAEVLAADYGGCLPVVFDDAFAYSDPVRVQELQRMLDLAATRGLQVIVLSCNPTDYASLGAKRVSLRSEQHAPSLAATLVPDSSDSASPDSMDPLREPAEGVEVTDELRQTLLNALSKADGSKGNQSLRLELGWDEATYDAVKSDLATTGKLILGRGRGGSVSLPSPG